MFDESADILLDFLDETHMDSRVVRCIEEYLAGRGQLLMSDVADIPVEFMEAAKDIDKLGWDNLLEGRIPSSLVRLQHTYLLRNNSYWKIRTWSSHLIQHLLNVTHRQWLYRNAKIHIRKLENLTANEHNTVIELVKDMMLVDPTDLLPRHRILLEQDFMALGEGSTIDRKVWLAKMNSALLAAKTQEEQSSQSPRVQSGMAVAALDRYMIYREQSGLLRTRRSNLAKRVRIA